MLGLVHSSPSTTGQFSAWALVAVVVSACSGKLGPLYPPVCISSLGDSGLSCDCPSYDPRRVDVSVCSAFYLLSQLSASSESLTCGMEHILYQYLEHVH